MRKSEIQRKTAETDIKLSVSLDGDKNADVHTGCGFLNHMLELFSYHSGFSLSVTCSGDFDVDFHHTTEDVGIALGEALKGALGDKRGINRYADIVLPMDETLVLCALDISGRAFLNFDVSIPAQKIGDFDSELCEEFFAALVRTSGITLHFKLLSGKNSHHIAEAVFKAFGRCMRQAAAQNPNMIYEIPSSKGVL